MYNKFNNINDYGDDWFFKNKWVSLTYDKNPDNYDIYQPKYDARLYFGTGFSTYLTNGGIFM